MAKVVYGVMQKPLMERMVDAACIYWDVGVGFFSEKRKDEESTVRRHILFYLLKHEANMGERAIADKFGYSHSSVVEALGIIDFRKGNSRPIADHIRQISLIATNLEARVVVMDVRLEHFFGGKPPDMDGEK